MPECTEEQLEETLKIWEYQGIYAAMDYFYGLDNNETHISLQSKIK